MAELPTFIRHQYCHRRHTDVEVKHPLALFLLRRFRETYQPLVSKQYRIP